MSDIGSAPPWITTVVTSFFSAVAGAAGAAWWARGLLADTEGKHDKKVADAKKEIKDEHDRLFREAKEEHVRLSREVKEEADTLAHSFGEGLSAIRQKVHDVEKKLYEVETWNRDNFVRREDFFEAMKTIHRSLENLSSELKMSMTEVRSKMERLLVGGGRFNEGGK